MQERARGDGLDGFSEAHFVREQPALDERQVKHAFALVGVQRNPRFLGRPFARLHFLFVLPPENLALLRLPERLQPGCDVLRDAQVGDRGVS